MAKPHSRHTTDLKGPMVAEVVTGLVGGDLTTDVPEDINIAICVHVCIFHAPFVLLQHTVDLFYHVSYFRKTCAPNMADRVLIGTDV